MKQLPSSKMCDRRVKNMNKSPVYLFLLQWFLLLVGGAAAAVNTSLTAEAAKSSHEMGTVGIVGLGIIAALVLTAIEAVFAHVISSFESSKDLMNTLVEQWEKGLAARVWLCTLIPVLLLILAKVYEIDTITTYSQLIASGMPTDWAMAFSGMFVFAFEVCLVTSRFVDRQRKKALRLALEKSTLLDADIKYHRARYKAKLKTAEELGARNGYNEASERYAKAVDG